MVVGFNGAGLAALAHFHSDGGAGTLSRWAHPKPHWLFAIVVGACLRADCQSGSVMGSGLDRVAPRTPSGLTHAGGQDECVAHFLWFWFGPDGERLARCTRRLFALDAHWPCPGSYLILLACPLMHFLGHGHGHKHHQKQTSDGTAEM